MNDRVSGGVAPEILVNPAHGIPCKHGDFLAESEQLTREVHHVPPANCGHSNLHIASAVFLDAHRPSRSSDVLQSIAAALTGSNASGAGLPVLTTLAGLPMTTTVAGTSLDTT